MRADAQRNLGTLLEAAAAVFATSGVDAPVREIAEQAGVGVGTVYRHFPSRPDLVAAVFRREVDACAEAAAALSAKYAPIDALTRWVQRYVDFIATKRGLAKALQAGDAAFEGLAAYFEQRLCPALQMLLDAAADAGDVRRGVEPYDLLRAISSLCTPDQRGKPTQARKMVSLLVDGLRYGAGS